MDRQQPNFGSSVLHGGSKDLTPARTMNRRDAALFVTPVPEVKRGGADGGGEMGSRRLAKRPAPIDGEEAASKRQRMRDSAAGAPRDPSQPGPDLLTTGIIDLEDDDVQPETPAPLEQARAPAPGAVIDLEKQNERYELRSFGNWFDKDKVYAELQSWYARIFSEEAKMAMPGTDLRQRMEEIAQTTMSKEIEYLIDRDESTWSKVLKKHEKALNKELEQVLAMRYEIQRHQTRKTMSRTVIKEVEERHTANKGHLEKREKIIKELKIFTKID